MLEDQDLVYSTPDAAPILAMHVNSYPDLRRVYDPISNRKTIQVFFRYHDVSKQQTQTPKTEIPFQSIFPKTGYFNAISLLDAQMAKRCMVGLRVSDTIREPNGLTKLRSLKN